MAKFKVMSLQINTTGENVLSYIGKRYGRFLDYAKYHSDKAGIPDDANDLLNEVLLATLQKDSELLNGLYLAKKGQYTELDYFILRLIKINAHSLQSPFRWKYRNRNVDTDINLQRLKIVQEDPDEVDKSEILLKEYRLVAWIAKGLDLNDLERAVFNYRFIHDDPFIEWTGPEKTKKLYCIYTQVVRVIQTVLCERGLSLVRPKSKLTKREAELVTQFLNTHKIHKQKKEFNI